MCLLQDLRTRGIKEVDLILTDGHDGLLAAVSALFPATPRQRCLVHKERNVMNAIPKRERDLISTELSEIWNQPTKEQALTELAADYLGSTVNAIQRPYAVCVKTKSIS